MEVDAVRDEHAGSWLERCKRLISGGRSDEEEGRAGDVDIIAGGTGNCRRWAKREW